MGGNWWAVVLGEVGRGILIWGAVEVDRGTLEVDRGTLEVDWGTLKVDRVDRGTLEVDRGTLEVDRDTVDIDRDTVNIDQDTVDIKRSGKCQSKQSKHLPRHQYNTQHNPKPANASCDLLHTTPRTTTTLHHHFTYLGQFLEYNACPTPQTRPRWCLRKGILW